MRTLAHIVPFLVAIAVSAGATAAPAGHVPPLPEFEMRIPAGHPRIFVTPDGLDAFRARRLGPAKAAWAGLEAGAFAAVGQALPTEPTVDGEDVGAASSAAAGRVELLAFAALVGGDPAITAEARRLLLHLCGWDPAGATGMASHRDAACVLLLRLSRAYDWTHSSLDQADRDRVLATLRTRGEDAFRQLGDVPPGTPPDESRRVRLLEALGEAALALHRDLPEARAWLERTVPEYLALFPPWGGDDGGWSQGMRDWTWSVSSALLHAEALRVGLGIDPFSKPWYRSTGFFKLYAHPPLRSGSSGSCPDAPAGLADRMVMERLAAVFGEGRFQWYAGRIAADYGGIPAYLWKGDRPAPRPPADIPQGRLFRDAGVAALHTRLWDPAEDVVLFFRSNPQGSWGQAHADQNTFTLDAFGEPLAVASGWAAWDGEPQLREWMHQTAAHNGLLVNGRGQPIQSRSAAGRVAAFHSGTDYDYVVGDAASAYAGMLARCVRRVLFVRPRYFVVFDEAEAPVASRFTWTLHALERMQVEPGTQSALLRRGKACLLAQWLAPEGLRLTQTDRLPIPDEAASAAVPRQWHLTVAAPEETHLQRFLTLLAPFRAGEDAKVPASERVDSEHAVGVRIGVDLVGFRTSPDPVRVLLDDVESDGEAFAVHRGGSGQVTRLFVAAGSRITAGATLLLAMPAGSTASVAIEGERVDADLDLATEGEVALRLPVPPRQVLLRGNALPPASFAYDAETHLLRLRVPVGSGRLAVNPAAEEPLPPAPIVDIPLTSMESLAPVVRGRAALSQRVAPAQKQSIQLGLMRSVVGSLVAFGELPTAAGPYRLEGAEKSAVQLGGRPAPEKGVVWAAGPTDIVVEAAPAEMPRTLHLAPVPLAPELPAQPVPAQALEWPGIIRVEAEDAPAQDGGEARVVAGQEALSGGSGIAGWETPGHSLTWKFRTPHGGQYLLILKGTAVVPDARLLVRYDGRYTPDAWRPVRFPAGAAIEGVPEGCTLFRVTDPATLAMGEHTVTLTLLSGAMDLDLLAFQPVE